MVEACAGGLHLERGLIEVFGRGGVCGCLWRVGAVEHFVASDSDRSGSFDGQAYTATTNLSYSDADVAGDFDGFANFSAEHQHWGTWGPGGEGGGGGEGQGSLRLGVGWWQKFREPAESAVIAKITQEFACNWRRNAGDR